MFKKILLWFWEWRFRRACVLNNFKAICFACFEPLTYESAHVITAETLMPGGIGRRHIHIFHKDCHARLSLKSRRIFYRLWFDKFSGGLPEGEWREINNALRRDVRF